MKVPEVMHQMNMDIQGAMTDDAMTDDTMHVTGKVTTYFNVHPPLWQE